MACGLFALMLYRAVSCGSSIRFAAAGSFSRYVGFRERTLALLLRKRVCTPRCGSFLFVCFVFCLVACVVHTKLVPRVRFCLRVDKNKARQHVPSRQGNARQRKGDYAQFRTVVHRRVRLVSGGVPPVDGDR